MTEQPGDTVGITFSEYTTDWGRNATPATVVSVVLDDED